ncbi:MAG: hypothetical protein NZ602_05115 [Thermoguttaceae bacterium]|nr:hypothetical protein [Thermoguttaceae bacterium]MDW8039054.1 hypothetical protein [Thermoguttaceae bacterium]
MRTKLLMGFVWVAMWVEILGTKGYPLGVGFGQAFCGGNLAEAASAEVRQGESSSAEGIKNTDVFIRVSPRDPRYFEFSDGRPYVPIGLNLAVSPTGVQLGVSNVPELPDYQRWFRRLAENRGNFARIWLSSSTFDVEHQRSGQYDSERAKRIDQLLALARQYGIRLKLCLEYFRHIGDGPQPHFAKRLHHVSQGGPAEKTADFFDTARCREQFKGKLAWYQKRYGDDPIIFGWELWNEINCIAGGDWVAWSEVMLAELHRLFPKNLAMQSVGSFDDAAYRERLYRPLCTLPGNDVLQVHRYLDLGARLEVCRGPVDVLAADAVRELTAFGIQKPILLAESGAVEPRHTGPFKLYQKDTAGIILHDVLFAPFFAGAAGPGHIWHWDVYVDRMNLWWHFGRFASAIEGIDPPAERFQVQQIEHPRLRIYVLAGRKTWLAWCRDKENTWQRELAEGRVPLPVREASIRVKLPAEWIQSAQWRTYDPWTDKWQELKPEGDRLLLPEFTRSLVVRAERR